MAEAIALSSPSGRMSKRARLAANKRLSVALFGEGGLQRPDRQQTNEEKAALLRQRAKDLRGYAANGFRPRVHIKEAERLEAEAAALEG
jgi:hypothetical protein